MVIIREITDSLLDPELRAPLYNAEEYAVGLRKFGRRPATRLYVDCCDNQATTTNTTASTSDKTGSKHKNNNSSKNKKNSKNKITGARRQEMTMKGFSSITELLKKLRQDLKLSFPSFVREFVSEPYDGVNALLDVLKTIQLCQTDYAATMGGSLRCKQHHDFFRRALSDEYECLLCARQCLRCEISMGRLVNSAHGLYTVAVCTMSNLNKSRTMALELMTLACDVPPRGHQQVLEAVSTLRLRFGEPVRFKFLVGMLSSFGVASFQTSCLCFLNRLLETCPDRSSRVHLQCEIEEAGFNATAIKKSLDIDNNEHSQLLDELQRWSRGYLDVDQLCNTVQHNTQQTRRLCDQLDQVKQQLQRSDTALIQSRASEVQLRNRVSELDRQLEFCKNQLLLAQEEYQLMTGRLTATSDGHQRNLSFSGAPIDGAVSDSVSLDSGTCAGSRKETSPEEKEKESCSDEDTHKKISYQCGEVEEFENDQLCSEVIEVHNDIIAFVPCRDAGTQTNSASQPTLVRKTCKQREGSAVNAASSRNGSYFSCKTRAAKQSGQESDADVQEAIGQLSAVLHDAESSMSLTSGHSDSSYRASSAARDRSMPAGSERSSCEVLFEDRSGRNVTSSHLMQRNPVRVRRHCSNAASLTSSAVRTEVSGVRNAVSAVRTSNTDEDSGQRRSSVANRRTETSANRDRKLSSVQTKSCSSDVSGASAVTSKLRRHDTFSGHSKTYLEQRGQTSVARSASREIENRRRQQGGTDRSDLRSGRGDGERHRVMKSGVGNSAEHQSRQRSHSDVRDPSPDYSSGENGVQECCRHLHPQGIMNLVSALY